MQGTEKQNNTISLVNAILSGFKHPALKLQDVDITAEPNIMLGFPVQGQSFYYKNIRSLSWIGTISLN